MDVETLSISDPRWMETLGRLRHDFYHHPTYVQLEAQRLNAVAEALLVSDGDQLFFLPYLVRSCNLLFPTLQEPLFDAVSPYGYPGILISDSGRNSRFAAVGLAALQETLNERGVCAAFLRMNPILGTDFCTLFPDRTFHGSSQTVVLDLKSSEADLLQQLRKSHRKTLRRCKNRGYTVRVVSLVDVLDTFIEIYNQTMDRVKAKEPYYFGGEYFESLARLPGVHCCVVESGSTMAAACVLFECDGIVNTHLGATRTEFLANSPFTMVMWDTILWAKARGNRWLHFGGGVGGKDDSVLHFKAGFSDKRIQFLTSRLVINEAKYDQLIRLRAHAEMLTPETVLASSFFPAYRG